MSYNSESNEGPLPINEETLRPYLPAALQVPAKKDWVSFWNLSDFAAFTPPEDFVLVGDCHLTRGGVTVLGGWPGVGKSRAALGLAIAGATGRPWLGHEVHARFRTLIIQAENGEWRLKKELSEALPPQDLEGWILISPPPRFGLAFLEPGFRERIAATVQEFRPGLIIIDPWNRVAEGDRQGDYRLALEAILECLPGEAENKPAVMILHHLRKKGSEGVRKLGRELLHELAGSYQIGSAARCVFVLEPATRDTTDPTVVLTCCKNNDGHEGAPSAWIRSNGLFQPAVGFDMEAFANPEPLAKGKQIPESAIARALRGMAGETKRQAVSRLVDAGVCERSKAYATLAGHENVEEDSSHRLWWREDE